MKSPLAIYKEILKEHEITEELDVHPSIKLAYLQAQRDEQKAIINRLLFDKATAKIKQEESKDSTTADAHRKKYDDYTGDLRQLISALKINLDLIKEIEGEQSA